MISPRHKHAHEPWPACRLHCMATRLAGARNASHKLIATLIPGRLIAICCPPHAETMSFVLGPSHWRSGQLLDHHAALPRS